MAQIVTVPGYGTLEFPDGMSQEEMQAAITGQFIPDIDAGRLSSALDTGIVGERQWGPDPFAPDEDYEAALAEMSSESLFDLAHTAAADTDLGKYYRSRLDQPLPDETEDLWATRTGRMAPGMAPERFGGWDYGVSLDPEERPEAYGETRRAWLAGIRKNNPKLMGMTILGMGHLFDDEDLIGKGRHIKQSVEDGLDWSPKVGSMRDIDWKIGRAFDYAAFQVGNGVASIVVPIVGSVVGGVTGAIIGSAGGPGGTLGGAVLGARVGAGGGSFAVNYGDTMEYLMETEGMSEKEAAKLAVYPGIAMAAIDAMAIPYVLGLTGQAKKDFRNKLLVTFAKRVAKSGFAEGSAEFFQQVIQELVAEGVDSGWWGDKPPSEQDATDVSERLWHIADAFVGGLLTGQAVRAPTAVLEGAVTPSQQSYAEEQASLMSMTGMKPEAISKQLTSRGVSQDIITDVLERLPRTPEEAQTISNQEQAERGEPLLLPDLSTAPKPLAAPSYSPLPDSSVVQQDSVVYAEDIITNPDIDLAVNVDATSGVVVPYEVVERSLTAGGDFTTETGVGDTVYRVETSDGTAVTGPFRDRTSAEVVNRELNARIPEITQRADEAEANRRARESIEETARVDDAVTLETARSLEDGAAFFSAAQLSETEQGEETLHNVNKARQDRGLLKVQGSTLVSLGEIIETGKVADEEIDRLLELQVPVTREEGISVEEIIKVAQSKNIATEGAGWENFLYMSGGVKSLDNMRPELRGRVLTELNKLPAQVEPESQLPSPVAAPDFSGSQYSSLIAAARSKGGLVLGDVHRAIGIRRAGSKELVKKILDLAVKRGDLVKRRIRKPVLDAGGTPVRNEKGRIKRSDQTVWEAKPSFHSALPEGTRRQVAVEEIPIRSSSRPTNKPAKKAWGIVERALDEDGRVVGQRVVDTYSDLFDREGNVRKSGEQQANERITALRQQQAQPVDTAAVREAALRRMGATGIPILTTDRDIPATERAAATTSARDKIVADTQRLKNAQLSAKAKYDWVENANEFAGDLAKRFRKVLKAKELDPNEVALKVVRSLAHDDEGKIKDINGIRTILVALDLAQNEALLSKPELERHLAGVLNHELIHLLRSYGVFSAAEWNILKKFVAAKKRSASFGGATGTETYLEDAQGLYPDLLLEDQYEEAIAEAYRDWAESPSKVVAGKPANLFKRIMNFFQGVGDVLAQRNLLSVDKIFSEVETVPKEPTPSSPEATNNRRRERVRLQRQLTKEAQEVGQGAPDVSPEMMSRRRDLGYEAFRGKGMTITLEQGDDMAVLTIEGGGQRVEVRGQPGIGSVYTGAALEQVIDAIPRRANISSLFAGETLNLPPAIADSIINVLEKIEVQTSKPIDEMLSKRRPRGTRADLEIANAINETNRQDEGSEEGRRHFAKNAVSIHRARADGFGYSRGLSESELVQDQRVDGSLLVDFRNLNGQFLYLPDEQLSNLYIEGGNSTPVFIELQSGLNSAKIFEGEIKKAVSSQGRAGKAVHVYPVEHTKEEAGYSQMRLFLSNDRNVGFALKGDDIVSVFKHKRYRYDSPAGALIELAVQEGGRRLDAFDTILPWAYSRNGFRGVARTPWEDEHAPKGWDYNYFKKFNDGRPDVVYMIYDPDRFDIYRDGEGIMVSDPDEAVAIQKEVVSTGRLIGITDLADMVPGFKGLVASMTLFEQDRLLSGSVNQAVNKLVSISASLPNAGEMASVAYAGRVARGWYERSAKIIVSIFGLNDGYRFAALLASTSPVGTVADNLTKALKVWNQWVKDNRSTVGMSEKDAGPAVDQLYSRAAIGGMLDAHRNNMIRALTAKDGDVVELSGPKVNSFLMNLFGVVSEITHDTHMSNYALLSQDIFKGQARKSDRDRFGVVGKKGPGYIAYNIASRRAAQILTKRTGETWTPEQVQESVWTLVRSLLEIRKAAAETRTAPQLLREETSGALQREMEQSDSFVSLFAQDIFRSLLVEAGYANQLEGITELEASRRRDSAGTYGRGGVFSAEGAGITGSTFERHLLSTAARLETVYERRRDTDTEYESRRRSRFKEPRPIDADTPILINGSPTFGTTMLWAPEGGKPQEVIVVYVRGRDEVQEGKRVGYGRRHASRHEDKLLRMGYTQTQDAVEDLLNAMEQARPDGWENMTIEEVYDHYRRNGIVVDRRGGSIGFSWDRLDSPFPVTGVFSDIQLGDLDTYMPTTPEERARAERTPVMSVVSVYGDNALRGKSVFDEEYTPPMSPLVSLVAQRAFANSPVGGVNTDRPILTFNRQIDEKLSRRRSRNNTPDGDELYTIIYNDKLNDESFGSSLLRIFGDSFGLNFKPGTFRRNFIDTATGLWMNRNALRVIDLEIKKAAEKFEVDGAVPLIPIEGTLMEEVAPAVVNSVTSEVMKTVTKLAEKGRVGEQISLPSGEFVTIEDKMKLRVSYILSGQLKGYDDITADFDAWAAARMAERASTMFAFVATHGPIMYSRGHFHGVSETPETDVLPEMVEVYEQERAELRELFYANPDILRKLGIDTQTPTGGARPMMSAQQAMQPVIKRNEWKDYFVFAFGMRSTRLIGEGRERLANREQIARAVQIGEEKPHIKEAWQNMQLLNASLVHMAVKSGIFTEELGKIFLDTMDYMPYHRLFQRGEQFVFKPQIANDTGIGVLLDTDSGQVAQITNHMFSNIAKVKPPDKELRGGKQIFFITIGSTIDPQSWNKEYLNINDPALQSRLAELKRMNKGSESSIHIKSGSQRIGDPLENMLSNISSLIQASMSNIAYQRAIRDLGYLNLAAPLAQDVAAEATHSMNVVAVRVKGVEKWFSVADPISFSWFSRGFEHLPGLELIGAPANLMRELVTKTIGFFIANPIRDTQSVFVSSGARTIPFVGSMIGFVQDLSNALLGRFGKAANQLQMTTGSGSYDFKGEASDFSTAFMRGARRHRFNFLRRGAYKTPVGYATGALTAPFWQLYRAVDRVSSASEMAGRVDVFKATLKETYELTGTPNEAQAAFEAIEVINFASHGDNPLWRYFTTGTPFLNARMIGVDVVYRAGTGVAGGAGLTGWNTAARQRRFVMRSLGLVSVVGAVYLAQWKSLEDDDDDYLKDKTETQRDLNWIISWRMLGFDKDGGVMIPTGFEVGLFFKTLPERLAKLMAGQGLFGDKASPHMKSNAREFMQSIVRNVKTTLNIGEIPQLFRPMFELSNNFDTFRSKPIVNKWREAESPFGADPRRTSYLARKLSKRLYETNNLVEIILGSGLASLVSADSFREIHAERIDHFITGYLPGLGIYALEAASAIMMEADGIERPTREIGENPFIGRFIGSPYQVGATSDWLWLSRELKKAVRVLNDYKQIEDPVGEEAARLRLDPILDREGYIKSLDDNVRRIQKEISKIWEMKGMSGDEKAERVSELADEQRYVLRNAREFRQQIQEDMPVLGR